MTEAERRERGEEIMARFSAASGPAGEPPLPGDTYGLVQAARRAWESDPKLRVEFGDSFERYLAYAKAEARGAVRIFGRGRGAS